MVLLYLLAIIAANLSIVYFGAAAVVANAFVFIGLDLVARDRLHDRWRGHGLPWRMGILIATGSILSYLLNRNAGPIALASFIAFTCAAIVDSLVYGLLHRYTWMVRANGSNIAAATVDSYLFLSLAGLPLFLAPIQVIAKIAGGLLWSIALHKTRQERMA